MAFKRSVVGLVLIGATVIASACSSNTGLSVTTSATRETTLESTPASSIVQDAEFSFAANLAEIPEAVAKQAATYGYDEIIVVSSDLDAATKLGGLTRPTNDSDERRVGDWIYSVRGSILDKTPGPLAARLPAGNRNEIGRDFEEYRADLGWSLLTVKSFVELDTPPDLFTVMRGNFSADALTSAIGKPKDDIWRIGGADGSNDPSHRTAARPAGESMQLSLDGGRLAISRFTPAIEAWRSIDSAPTLADDAGLSAVAAELDRADAYSAILAEGAFRAPERPDTSGVPKPTASPAGDAAPGLGPFTALGIGQIIDHGTPSVVFAYYYADERAAQAAAAPLQALLAQAQWKSKFAVRTVVATGNMLVATLDFKDFAPSKVWSIFTSRDSLVISSD